MQSINFVLPKRRNIAEGALCTLDSILCIRSNYTLEVENYRPEHYMNITRWVEEK